MGRSLPLTAPFSSPIAKANDSHSFPKQVQEQIYTDRPCWADSGQPPLF